MCGFEKFALDNDLFVDAETTTERIRQIWEESSNERCKCVTQVSHVEAGKWKNIIKVNFCEILSHLVDGGKEEYNIWQSARRR